MGSFVFKWDHPASEVYVTGTFDDWSKSEKLDRVGDSFSKEVTLAKADEKIYYKFVVDGNWVTDHTAPQENDASGNLNNVLTTDRIVKKTAPSAGILSGVAPHSTTADLAKDVPLEKSTTGGSSALPGAFPETPAAEVSVNPLPATSGATNPIDLVPGEKVPDSSNFTNKSVTSGVHDDPELVEKLKAQEQKKEGEQTFGVAPLPAFPGGVNPVTLAPGEKVPDASNFTSDTVASTAHDDPELVEKLLKAEKKKEGHESADAGPFTQSAGPQSTTAALAADVPLESSKVPEIVKESQQAAGVEPEASAIAEEVREKSAVEKELESKVPTVPSTSEGIAGQGTTKSEKQVTAGEAAAAVSGAAIALGGAAYAATSGLASKLPASVTSKLPVGVQESINNINSESNSKLAASKNTPAVVQESIAESGKAPEAAANEEAVVEKKQVESELLSEVKKVDASGEPAPKPVEKDAQYTDKAPSTPIKNLTAPVIASEPGSRDVSPGTIPGSRVQTRQEQTEPTVTSGVGSSTTAEQSTPTKSAVATPTKPAASASKTTDSPASASASQKKKNRASAFFSKIKSKLSDK